MSGSQLPRAAGVLFTALLILGTTTGCASMRGVAVESDPGPVYTLEISNGAAYAMRVYYDDGTGSQLLGMIEAGTADTFVISSPARNTVTLRATDANGGREVRRTVTLVQGTSARVRLSG